MKAWVVSLPEEFTGLFHEDTRGKAKLRFMEEYDVDRDLFLEIRVTRLAGQDDKPFTYENAKDAGFQYTCYDWDDASDTFISDCRCAICKAHRK